ncbi:hypothetical protein IPC1122_34305 [Pseudomonas aeruginosa]|nr:hypothetical protein AN399_30720 [Pseudomonas aeruginosa]KRU87658.1 hypothetical protein AN453_05575 [Pseudomonas aeruginosa]KSM64013.1 hypothetical protein APA70_25555 [Pseudomonas aeruginosa]KSO10382.1 hypothetical protein APA84_21000 [Pseudomonas aeruginosa]KSR05780.1 hypothetical protein APB37_23715 [Pseudomonas aeruginosa]
MMNKGKRMDIKLVLGLAVLLVGAGSAQASALKDEVDRFNGLRSIEWLTMPARANTFAFKTTVLVPEKVEARQYYGYLFTYGQPGFATCNHTQWLIDGRRAPEIQTTYSRSGELEYFELAKPEAMLPILAAAKKVEFKVCGVEGEISSSDLDGIREVLDRAKQDMPR